jgi:transcriptional regulator with GAF, ATPase, and Fis domain
MFELASGGSLFIDEVGELPLPVQAMLLRVLEGHSFRRVGGERDILVDVRFICATNRDLKEQVAAGRFRGDLYHRLKVFEVTLPPLRERGGDISELAQYFTGLLGDRLGYPSTCISAEALAILEAYHWPGNVRELRNVIERAVLLCRDEPIAARHLPAELMVTTLRRPEEAPAAEPTPAAFLDVNLEAAIRRHVLAVYERHGRNLTQAASALGVSRMALRRRLRAYGKK